MNRHRQKFGRLANFESLECRRMLANFDLTLAEAQHVQATLTSATTVDRYEIDVEPGIYHLDPIRIPPELVMTTGLSQNTPVNGHTAIRSNGTLGINVGAVDKQIETLPDYEFSIVPFIPNPTSFDDRFELEPQTFPFDDLIYLDKLQGDTLAFDVIAGQRYRWRWDADDVGLLLQNEVDPFSYFGAQRDGGSLEYAAPRTETVFVQIYGADHPMFAQLIAEEVANDGLGWDRATATPLTESNTIELSVEPREWEWFHVSTETASIGVSATVSDDRLLLLFDQLDLSGAIRVYNPTSTTIEAIFEFHVEAVATVQIEDPANFDSTILTTQFGDAGQFLTEFTTTPLQSYTFRSDDHRGLVSAVDGVPVDGGSASRNFTWSADDANSHHLTVKYYRNSHREGTIEITSLSDDFPNAPEFATPLSVPAIDGETFELIVRKNGLFDHDYLSFSGHSGFTYTIEWESSATAELWAGGTRVIERSASPINWGLQSDVSLILGLAPLRSADEETVALKITPRVSVDSTNATPQTAQLIDPTQLVRGSSDFDFDEDVFVFQPQPYTAYRFQIEGVERTLRIDQGDSSFAIDHGQQVWIQAALDPIYLHVSLGTMLATDPADREYEIRIESEAIPTSTSVGGRLVDAEDRFEWPFTVAPGVELSFTPLNIAGWPRLHVMNERGHTVSNWSSPGRYTATISPPTDATFPFDFRVAVAVENELQTAASSWSLFDYLEGRRYALSVAGAESELERVYLNDDKIVVEPWPIDDLWNTSGVVSGSVLIRTRDGSRVSSIELLEVSEPLRLQLGSATYSQTKFAAFLPDVSALSIRVQFSEAGSARILDPEARELYRFSEHDDGRVVLTDEQLALFRIEIESSADFQLELIEHPLEPRENTTQQQARDIELDVAIPHELTPITSWYKFWAEPGYRYELNTTSASGTLNPNIVWHTDQIAFRDDRRLVVTAPGDVWIEFVSDDPFVLQATFVVSRVLTSRQDDAETARPIAVDQPVRTIQVATGADWYRFQARRGYQYVVEGLSWRYVSFRNIQGEELSLSDGGLAESQELFLVIDVVVFEYEFRLVQRRPIPAAETNELGELHVEANTPFALDSTQREILYVDLPADADVRISGPTEHLIRLEVFDDSKGISVVANEWRTIDAGTYRIVLRADEAGHQFTIEAFPAGFEPLVISPGKHAVAGLQRRYRVQTLPNVYYEYEGVSPLGYPITPYLGPVPRGVILGTGEWVDFELPAPEGTLDFFRINTVTKSFPGSFEAAEFQQLPISETTVVTAAEFDFFVISVVEGRSYAFTQSYALENRTFGVGLYRPDRSEIVYFSMPSFRRGREWTSPLTGDVIVKLSCACSGGSSLRLDVFELDSPVSTNPDAPIDSATDRFHSGIAYAQTTWYRYEVDPESHYSFEFMDNEPRARIEVRGVDSGTTLYSESRLDTTVSPSFSAAGNTQLLVSIRSTTSTGFRVSLNESEPATDLSRTAASDAIPVVFGEAYVGQSGERDTLFRIDLQAQESIAIVSGASWRQAFIYGPDRQLRDRLELRRSSFRANESGAYYLGVDAGSEYDFTVRHLETGSPSVLHAPPLDFGTADLAITSPNQWHRFDATKSQWLLFASRQIELHRVLDDTFAPVPIRVSGNSGAIFHVEQGRSYYLNLFEPIPRYDGGVATAFIEASFDLTPFDEPTLVMPGHAQASLIAPLFAEAYDVALRRIRLDVRPGRAYRVTFSAETSVRGAIYTSSGELVASASDEITVLPSTADNYLLSVTTAVADLPSMIAVQVEVSYGDVNLDGRFDSADLVALFRRGEYEDELFGNSDWLDGDWNDDGEFDSSDLVLALQRGHYNR